jgi:radical SAM protein with 4Fe4S-binding SPASM domain
MKIMDKIIKQAMYLTSSKVKDKHIDAFFRYHSWSRLRNLIRVETGKFFKKSSGFGYPYVLTVEPTNICNLSCTLCPTGQGLAGRPKRHMNLEAFDKLLNEVKPYVYLMNFQTWGEPMLGRNTIPMVRHAHDARIFTAIQTNGNYPSRLNRGLVEAGLDHISFAVDGSTQALYESYRVGGNLEMLCANIKALQEIKRETGSRKPFVEIIFLVFKHTQHDLEGIRALAEKLDVDGLLIRAANSPGNEENRRKYYTWNKKKGFCSRFWYIAIISNDGGIVPCCNFFDKKKDFDNVFEASSFLEAWENEDYVRYRKAVLAGKPEDLPQTCKECKIYKEDVLYDHIWGSRE